MSHRDGLWSAGQTPKLHLWLPMVGAVWWGATLEGFVLYVNGCKKMISTLLRRPHHHQSAKGEEAVHPSRCIIFNWLQVWESRSQMWVDSSDCRCSVCSRHGHEGCEHQLLYDQGNGSFAVFPKRNCECFSFHPSSGGRSGPGASSVVESASLLNLGLLISGVLWSPIYVNLALPGLYFKTYDSQCVQTFQIVQSGYSIFFLFICIFNNFLICEKHYKMITESRSCHLKKSVYLRDLFLIKFKLLSAILLSEISDIKKSIFVSHYLKSLPNVTGSQCKDLNTGAMCSVFCLWGSLPQRSIWAATVYWYFWEGRKQTTGNKCVN